MVVRFIALMVVLIFFLTACSDLMLSGEVIKNTEKAEENVVLDRFITVEELEGIYENPDVKVVDVRNDWEYRTGHIKGSKNIPLSGLDRIRLNAEDVTEEDRIILYDETGKQSETAYNLFSAFKYEKVQILQGGLDAWKEKNLPTREGYG